MFSLLIRFSRGFRLPQYNENQNQYSAGAVLSLLVNIGAKQNARPVSPLWLIALAILAGASSEAAPGEEAAAAEAPAGELSTTSARGTVRPTAEPP
jgi:hypothetical protein